MKINWSHSTPPDRYMDQHYRYQAQSLLTEGGKRGPLLSVGMARAVVRWSRLRKEKTK